MSNAIKNFFKEPFRTMRHLEARNFRSEAAANPFVGVAPGDRQNFLTRLRQTLSVLMGSTRFGKHDRDGLMYSLFGNDHPAYKQGVFGYLIGLPMHAVYTAIPGTFYLIGLLGKNLFDFADFIFKVSGKLPYVGRLLTMPFWFAFGVAGIAIALPGLIGYAVTKPILHVVNRLIQDVVVPVVSRLALLALLPIVGIVHLVLKAKEAGAEIEDRIDARQGLKGGSTSLLGRTFPIKSSSKKEAEYAQYAQYKGGSGELSYSSRASNVSYRSHEEVRSSSSMGMRKSYF